MKDLIKIFVAFAFITGGFFVGQFKAKEKYSEQINMLNIELKDNQIIILQLKDSLNVTMMEINKLKKIQPNASINLIKDSNKKNSNQ